MNFKFPYKGSSWFSPTKAPLPTENVSELLSPTIRATRLEDELADAITNLEAQGEHFC